MCPQEKRSKTLVGEQLAAKVLTVRSGLRRWTPFQAVLGDVKPSACA